MNNDDRLLRARAHLAERRRADELQRRAAEFEVTRPTPSQQENDLLANDGTITMVKLWDLSPIDPSSFDPTEPPGRPA